MSTLVRAFEAIEIDQSAPHLAAPKSAQGLLLAKRSLLSPIFVVTASTRAANDLQDELETYLGAGSVAQFPAWETLPHEKLSPKLSLIHI